MHNTEVKTDIIVQHNQDQLPHHSQASVSQSRRMTNGDGMVTGSSRHHRDGATLAMGTSSNECAGCGKRITDRFLLKALDMFWHEDCLKCGCCDCRLGEVGSTLYTKANLILCKRDYLRLFGNTGYCAACSKVIPAFEMVMRARNNVYHLECFACQQCNHRFCVGDRFYLCENKILCEYDYEERMVFANMACSPGNLAILRRQVSQPRVENDQYEQQPHHLNPSPGSFSIHLSNQQQFQLQSKHSLAFSVSQVPVSESFVSGNPSIFTSSPSPSLKHCSKTDHITKQVSGKQRTDIMNLKIGNLSPPYRRPKEANPSHETTSSNLVSPITQQYEWNNNNQLGNVSPLFPSTVPILPNELLIPVTNVEDTGQRKSLNKQKNTFCGTGLESPDSGIVMGPY